MALELLDYRLVLTLLIVSAHLGGLEFGRLAGELPVGDHHYTLCIKIIKLVSPRQDNYSVLKIHQ